MCDIAGQEDRSATRDGGGEDRTVLGRKLRTVGRLVVGRTHNAHSTDELVESLESQCTLQIAASLFQRVVGRHELHIGKLP